VHRPLSGRHTAVGDLADFQGADRGRETSFTLPLCRFFPRIVVNSRFTETLRLVLGELAI
jgi:hypothetical protein